MSSHLAVQPHGGFQSLAERLFQLIYLLYDDALDYLWSLLTKKSKLERMVRFLFPFVLFFFFQLENSDQLRGSNIIEIENFLLRKLSVNKNKVFRLFIYGILTFL